MVGPGRLPAIMNASLVCLLCCGVILQMLGAPVSFGDLDGFDDDFVSNLLMGLAVPSSAPHYLALLSYFLPLHRSVSVHSFADESPLFHPPLFPLINPR